VKIGLTHTGNPEKNTYYLEWLKANEDIEIIQLSAEDNNLQRLNHCDALVLSGGIDIYPEFYGSDVTDYPGAPGKFNEKRDAYEIAAFRLAQENKIPVLGICRGMQLINVIHGGTLIQNLENETLNQVHTGNPDKSHIINIEEQTVLHEIIGAGKTEINSAHHQAIDKLGKGLLINARSDEGIVEGIERVNEPGKPFLLAIQWHPERMFRFHLENSPASQTIRNRFIEEIKKSKANKNENQ
jgi:putative glutamine amidotransferase